eukprot:CAMPEP_0174851050 /NCGR_PEP_ID=MMETSP1114-20130205/21278_1 /TAXON_ID=312471 /ORGANISM="Neobodo designis, Strain CCAP 1951/1" /LENGTH=401 /DNA_ID=CAMNT_0016085555 /DNA_START=32 /DNA_END=1237 /DNA_ORIENTATION=+
MFGAMSSWLQAGEDAANALAEKAGFALEKKNTAEASPSSTEVPSALISEAPGSDWEDTQIEWRTLIQGVLEDENTFLIAGGRLLADDRVAQRLHGDDAFDFSRIPAPPSSFDTETKPWIACIGEPEGFANLRYHLVPALVSEENFWHNCVWRLRALRSMRTVAGALAFLRIVNTEPTAPPEDPDAPRLRNIGRHDNGRALSALEASVSRHRKAAEWGATKADTLKAELSSCRSNLQLLRNLMAARDLEQMELAQSVRESVEFHKTKLASHIADIDNADEEALAAAPLLAPPEGALYAEALEVNASVQGALREYAVYETDIAADLKAREEKERRDASPPAQGTPLAAGSATSGSSPVIVLAPSPNDAVTSPATGLPHGTGSNGDDAAFNATVPWDDDDDEDM